MIPTIPTPSEPGIRLQCHGANPLLVASRTVRRGRPDGGAVCQDEEAFFAGKAILRRPHFADAGELATHGDSADINGTFARVPKDFRFTGFIGEHP